MQRSAAPAVVTVAMLTLISCGGSADTPSTTVAVEQSSTTTRGTAGATTTTLGVTSTTADPDDPRAAILEAHKGFWDTWLAANNPPNPDHPGLRKYYTGEAYDHAVSVIEKNRREGIAIRLPTNSRREHRGSVTAFNGVSAIVSDCAIDDGIIFRTEDGEVLDESVVTTRWTISLVLERGVWRVANATKANEWKGSRGCE